MSTLATTADRGTIVRAVCVREWRESLGNRLLVGMTVLPPLVILIAGIGAVAWRRSCRRARRTSRRSTRRRRRSSG